VVPRSSFDEHQGRVFRLSITAAGGQTATTDAAALLEYQALQAVLAHHAREQRETVRWADST